MYGEVKLKKTTCAKVVLVDRVRVLKGKRVCGRCSANMGYVHGGSRFRLSTSRLQLFWSV